MSRANVRFKRTNTPLPVIGSQPAAQITVRGVCEGAATATTWGFLGPAGVTPTPGNIAGLLAAFKLASAAKYRACLSNDWLESIWLCACLVPNTVVTQTDVSTAGSPGTGGAGHLPTNDAVTTIRYTAVKGQHGRGRTNMGPLPAAAQAVGTSFITVGYKASVTTLLAATAPASFSDGVNSWVAAILQKSTASPHPVVGAAAIIAQLVNANIGSARKRKVNR